MTAFRHGTLAVVVRGALALLVIALGLSMPGRGMAQDDGPIVCTVQADVSVNQRSSPGTGYPVVANMTPGEPYAALGQAIGTDGMTWWQLEDASWVRFDVVLTEGDCENLPVVTGQGTMSDQARVAFHEGLVRLNQDNLPEALAQLELALGRARQAEDTDYEALILSALGVAYQRVSRYDAAVSAFEGALELWQQLDEPDSEAVTFEALGTAYRLWRHYDEAMTALEQSLALRREQGDRAGEAGVLHAIGQVYLDQGLYMEATDYLQRALPLRIEVHDRQGEAQTLYAIGTASLAQGRYDEAERLFEQALAIQQAVGDRDGEIDTLSAMGMLYTARGEGQEGATFYRQAEALQEVTTLTPRSTP